MNIQEGVKLINDLEKKYPVEKWNIEDLHIWPLIRISLAFSLGSINKNSSQDKNIIHKYLFFLKNTIRYIGAYLYDYKNNSKIEKNDIILLKNSNRFYYNGWYDIETQPLIDCFQEKNMKTLVLEITQNNEYRVPRYGKSKYIQVQINLLLAKSEFGLDNGISGISYNLDNYDDFCFYLKKNIPSLKIPTLTELQKSYRRLLLLKDYFVKILLKCRPKLAFVVCYYSTIQYAYILACKELKIPVIDIQHGVQGNLHKAYGNWSKVPVNGYEVLPDYFWCWSQHEVDAINNWRGGLKTHIPLNYGNPWLEKWKYGDVKMIEHFQKKYESIKVDKGKIHILYTLQTGIPFPEWIFVVIKKYENEFFWWIRLHPGMSLEKTKYIKMFREFANCNIDMASDLPLLTLLKNMDIHVTCFSSTVIEAEHFNVPSIILNKDAIEMYNEQVKNGNCFFANKKTFVETVRKLLDEKATIKKVQEKSNYNLHRILDDLIFQIKHFV